MICEQWLPLGKSYKEFIICVCVHFSKFPRHFTVNMYY